MAAFSLSLCTLDWIFGLKSQQPLGQRVFQGKILDLGHQSHRSHMNRRPRRIYVLAATGGSTNSKESEESIPSWARPNSDEPPPWARDEGQGNESKTSIEIPYIAYLLASAVTAIAAIGSVFEYVNQRPVFGVVNSDSIFYVPLLGFFAITGLPTCAFLWFKAVQVANKEAEEQDRRDGYL